MAIIKTDCSCGEQHEFDKSIIAKMQWTDTPEFIDCSDCPICTPELLERPEDREDEAYSQEADIEELLKEEEIEDIEDQDEDFEEDLR